MVCVLEYFLGYKHSFSCNKQWFTEWLMMNQYIAMIVWIENKTLEAILLSKLSIATALLHLKFHPQQLSNRVPLQYNSRSLKRYYYAPNSLYPTLVLAILSYVHELLCKLNEKLSLFIFSSVINNHWDKPHLLSLFSKRWSNNIQSLTTFLHFQLVLHNSQVPAADSISDSNYNL